MGLWNGREIRAIELIGNTGSGKTSFAWMILPERKNSPGDPKVCVIDTEGSSTLIRQALKADVIDVWTQVTAQKDLFLCAIDAIRNIPAGKYDVIIVDTFSKFAQFDRVFQYISSTGWNGAPQKIKPEFRGYWTKQWAIAFVNGLKNKCKTVVFCSHAKIEYDKVTSAPTGRIISRSLPITEEVDLSCVLHRNIDPDWKNRRLGQPGHANQFWMSILKSRLTNVVFTDDKGNLLPAPRYRDLLPMGGIWATNESEKQETLVTLLRKYLSNPQADYGEMDEAVSSFVSEADMEEFQKTRELELARANADIKTSDLAQKIEEAKAKMVNKLVNEDRLYTDRADVGAIMKQLGLIERARDLNEYDTLYQELKAHRTAQLETTANAVMNGGGN